MNDLALLFDGPEDGARAMARDETMVRRQREGEGPVTIVRVHGWSRPVLSLGRSQDIPEGLAEHALRVDVEVVRRPTGGGWLLHWPGDLAVTVAYSGPLRAGELRRCSRHLAQSIALGLSAHRRPAMVFDGADATKSRAEVCFERVDRDEVVVDRTKVAGVALCRYGRAALVQSAIPLTKADEARISFSDRWDPLRAAAVVACAGVDRDGLSRTIVAAFAAVGSYREGRPWSWPPAWLRDAEARRNAASRSSSRQQRGAAR